MKRSDLIIKLSLQTGLSFRKTEELVAMITDTMAQQLAAGNRIEIRGFGTFEATYRPARTVRNPRSGETFAREGKYFPTFKAGKFLRYGLTNKKG